MGYVGLCANGETVKTAGRKNIMDSARIIKDEPDDVVQEFPLFHSTRLHKNLFCFRYPLHSQSAVPMHIIRGRIKLRAQQVELEQAIDVTSPNFDVDRARKLAVDTNNKCSRIETVRLIGHPCASAADTQYAVMLFNGREVHMTTLRNLLEFTPNVDFLDGKRRKGGNGPGDFDGADEAEAAAAEPEAVTVKFKQQRGKCTALKDAKSAVTDGASIIDDNDEPWTECEILEDNGGLLAQQLLAENTDETGQGSTIMPQKYLEVLIPKDEEVVLNQPSLPSHMMSLHALRALPLHEQCRLLLKDAQIIRFQQLLMVLAGNEGLTADTLLRCLPKVAVLVCGNWVVRSEILYPHNSLSSTSGVPAEVMCRARDYILCLFTKNQFVERKQISSVINIPSEELKEIFMGISRQSHHKRGWQLLLPPDTEFIVRHADLVQRQFEFCEQRYTAIMDFFRSVQASKQRRRKSKSCSSDTDAKGSPIVGGAGRHTSDSESTNVEKQSPKLGGRRRHNSSGGTDK